MKEYIEYKGETYGQALEVLERHAITELVDRDGVSYVASMIAMFEAVEHMQAERITELELELKALRFDYVNVKSEIYDRMYSQLNSLRCSGETKSAVWGLLQFIWNENDKLDKLKQNS